MSSAGAPDRRVVSEFPVKIFRPQCNRCGETYSKAPKNWNCPNCNVKCWQSYEKASYCSVCGDQVGAMNRRHCHRHGGVVCGECGQYYMQLQAGEEKERVCKGCAFPAGKPECSGNLIKISRDPLGKETSRNQRYFELRRNTLMYSTTTTDNWRGFYRIDGCKVADDIEHPSLAFTITGGKLPNPLHLLCERVPDKTKWINAIMAASTGGVGVGTSAYESTEADGHSGFMDLVDGGRSTKLFFRIKGTELKMAKDRNDAAFDSILLHGGTVVQDAPPNQTNARITLQITGPRLPNPLFLVCKDETNKNEWKRNLLCAQRGGKFSNELPPVSIKTDGVEGARAVASSSSSSGSSSPSASASSSSSGGRGLGPKVRGELELREHVLCWDNDAFDLRLGCTVSIDPNRARFMLISGQAVNPALALYFDDDAEFIYWKQCLQAVSCGKPLPMRQFNKDQEPSMKGNLTKVGSPKGISQKASLNRRFFFLHEHFLQYSEEEGKETKGEFDIYQAEVSDSAQYPMGFFISGPRMKRPVILIADNGEERESWKEALDTAARFNPTTKKKSSENKVPSSSSSTSHTSRRRKGIGLPSGQTNPIDLMVAVEISRDRQMDLMNAESMQLSRWHGASIPLTGIDAVTCTLEDLQGLIESVLEVPGYESSGGELTGVLFVPGRYVAFRRPQYDAQDVVSDEAHSSLEELRGDDEVATLLHRLPDTMHLDEIPLRSGDKLVWKDVASTVYSKGPSPIRSDLARLSLLASPRKSASKHNQQEQQDEEEEENIGILSPSRYHNNNNNENKNNDNVNDDLKVNTSPSLVAAQTVPTTDNYNDDDYRYNNNNTRGNYDNTYHPNPHHHYGSVNPYVETNYDAEKIHQGKANLLSSQILRIARPSYL